MIYLTLLTDPYDCRAYYICPKTITADTVGLRRACLSTEIFSESTGTCVTASSSSACTTVNCSNTMGNGLYTPYGTSTKYYAICSTSTTADMPPVPTTTRTMVQCPTGAAFDKSATVSKCIYKCSAAGKFAYSLDSTKYYDCVKGTDGKITATLTACETGTVFSTTDKDCAYVSALKDSILLEDQEIV